MLTRKDALDFALTLPNVYADAPFHDDNWTLVRRNGTRRTFLCVYERQGRIWLNLKCTPEMGVVWRGAYAAIIPAYHMNKEHWISVILDGSVPHELIESLIEESYALCAPRIRQKTSPGKTE